MSLDDARISRGPVSRESVPHAKVVELAGAGHWPHEEEPAAVLDAVRGFVGG